MNTDDLETASNNFLNILYGKYKGDGYLVIWTKPAKRSYFFSTDKFEEASDMACFIMVSACKKR
jgi:hypothetical protein